MFEALDAGRVSGEKLVGRWANVGTLEELARAEDLFAAAEAA